MFDAEAFTDRMVAAGYAPKTCAVYRPPLVRADAAGVDLDRVGPQELRDYAETLPRTRSSRALFRSALRCHWTLSGRSDGPWGAIRVPRQRKMVCRALDPEEAGVLARAALARGDRKGVAVLLGLYAGLRRGEIASMRWGDLGADGWLTVVGKGERVRVLPLHPVVLEALGVRGAGFVFPGRWGGPQHPTTVWGWAREVSAEAGLGAVATHVLRHTALATSLDATGDLRAVQELAGHASPETTAGYTRATRRRLVAAVGAISFP